MSPLPPRIALRILRACEVDQRAVCGRVRPGGGRIIACLAQNERALTVGRRQALARR
jgi:hypothetical protein